MTRARRRVAAEDLVWLAVIGGAATLAVAFAWLAPPLARHWPAPIHDVFPVWRILINPEPLEDVRAILALAAPIAIAAIVAVFGRPGPDNPRLDPVVIAVQLAGIGLIVLAILDQPQAGPLLSSDYFDRYLVSTANLIIGAVIGVALAAVMLRPPRGRVRDRVDHLWVRIRPWWWLALALAIAATAVWLLPAVNTDHTVTQAGSLASGHIPVQGEDYFAAVNGRTPMVDYIAQYANLLPLAVEPVLKLFGLSITSYTITMCALSGLAMLAIYGVFTAVTRQAWTGLLLFVPWVALSLFPWHDSGSHREFNGIYFGVFPGRYFGPFVLALLCALRIRGRAIPLWLLFGFSGLVVLNNYEFGIAAIFALIAALITSWDRSVPLGRRLTELVVEGVGGLLGALVLVCAIDLLRAGQVPDPSLLTYFNRLFLQDSFGLEPMSSLGMHWLLYGTYAAALLIAAVRYVRSEPDVALTGMLAYSGLFGLVTGMYFVGRSSQFQLVLLFPAWGIALALVAWAAAGALISARDDRARLRRLLLPALAALVGFGVMVAAFDRIPSPRTQIDRLRAGGPSENLGPDERFVASHTRPGENVLMIGTGPDHLVADRAGVVNVSPINGVTALVTPHEADRSLDELEGSGGELVFDGVSSLQARGLSFGIPQLAGILRERGYRLIATDPNLHLRVWRRIAS